MRPSSALLFVTLAACAGPAANRQEALRECNRECVTTESTLGGTRMCLEQCLQASGPEPWPYESETPTGTAVIPCPGPCPWKSAPAVSPFSLPVATPANPETIPARMLELANLYRAQAGRPSLTLNDQLARAAQGHADYMARTADYAHDTKTGSTPSGRIEEAGYVWGAYGENIAAGQTSPEEAMDSWMNSPGHRANILNPEVTEFGPGFSCSAHGCFWVQVFGAPRS